MAKLSHNDVLKLAKLARLKLSQEEVDLFSQELSDILGYVKQLDKASTKGLAPTLQVSGLSNVTREDKTLDYGYTPADLLKNVPQTLDHQIKTERMID